MASRCMTLIKRCTRALVQYGTGVRPSLARFVRNEVHGYVVGCSTMIQQYCCCCWALVGGAVVLSLLEVVVLEERFSRKGTGAVVVPRAGSRGPFRRSGGAPCAVGMVSECFHGRREGEVYYSGACRRAFFLLIVLSHSLFSCFLVLFCGNFFVVRGLLPCMCIYIYRRSILYYQIVIWIYDNACGLLDRDLS